MPMRRILLTIALSVLLAPAVSAAGLPYFDMKATCAKRATMSGDYIPMFYDACLRREQTSYDVLDGQWLNLPSEQRTSCVDERRSGKSYERLAECVGVGHRSRELTPAFLEETKHEDEGDARRERP